MWSYLTSFISSSPAEPQSNEVKAAEPEPEVVKEPIDPLKDDFPPLPSRKEVVLSSPLPVPKVDCADEFLASMIILHHSDSDTETEGSFEPEPIVREFLTVEEVKTPFPDNDDQIDENFLPQEDEDDDEEEEEEVDLEEEIDLGLRQEAPQPNQQFLSDSAMDPCLVNSIMEVPLEIDCYISSSISMSELEAEMNSEYFLYGVESQTASESIQYGEEDEEVEEVDEVDDYQQQDQQEQGLLQQLQEEGSAKVWNPVDSSELWDPRLDNEQDQVEHLTSLLDQLSGSFVEQYLTPCPKPEERVDYGDSSCAEYEVPSNAEQLADSSTNEWNSLIESTWSEHQQQDETVQEEADQEEEEEQQQVQQQEEEQEQRQPFEPARVIEVEWQWASELTGSDLTQDYEQEQRDVSYLVAEESFWPPPSHQEGIIDATAATAFYSVLTESAIEQNNVNSSLSSSSSSSSSSTSSTSSDDEEADKKRQNAYRLMSRMNPLGAVVVEDYDLSYSSGQPNGLESSELACSVSDESGVQYFYGGLEEESGTNNNIEDNRREEFGSMMSSHSSLFNSEFVPSDSIDEVGKVEFNRSLEQSEIFECESETSDSESESSSDSDDDDDEQPSRNEEGQDEDDYYDDDDEEDDDNVQENDEEDEEDDDDDEDSSDSEGDFVVCFSDEEEDDDDEEQEEEEEEEEEQEEGEEEEGEDKEAEVNWDDEYSEVYEDYMGEQQYQEEEDEEEEEEEEEEGQELNVLRVFNQETTEEDEDEVETILETLRDFPSPRGFPVREVTLSKAEDQLLTLRRECCDLIDQLQALKQKDQMEQREEVEYLLKNQDHQQKTIEGLRAECSFLYQLLSDLQSRKKPSGALASTSSAIASELLMVQHCERCGYDFTFNHDEACRFHPLPLEPTKWRQQPANLVNAFLQDRADHSSKLPPLYMSDLSPERYWVWPCCNQYAETALGCKAGRHIPAPPKN